MPHNVFYICIDRDKHCCCG